MVATTMPHIKSLANKIKADFNGYLFKKGDIFMWSPLRNTIVHPKLVNQEDIWNLLHEIAHAELRHTDYTLDIQLVGHEAAAWRFAAQTLAPRYHLSIDSDTIENHLDTYRIWLHQRSSCPQCGQTGLQTQNTYSCINCRCLWRANEARLCALRRFKLPVRSQLL